MQKSIQPYAWLLILLAVTIVCYLPGLSGPFLLDDLHNIYPARLQSFTLDELLNVSFSNKSGPLGRPISIATFALTDAAFGFTPFGYKLVNLVIHLGVTLLIYKLVRLCTRSLNFNLSDQFRVALLVAAMWCLHPIQVSTVLYSVQRMAQLSALFTVIGCILYLKFRLERQTLSYERKFLYIMAMIFNFIVGVFSKETVLLLPAYLFAIELFILGYQPDTSHSRWMRAHMGVLLIGFFSVLAYIWHGLPSIMLRYETYNFTMYERILTELTAVWHYVLQIALPRLHNFSLFHDSYPITEKIDFVTVLYAVLLAASIISAFIYRARYPLAAFGVAIYWISHLLESTIFPLELVFEHRVYFGSLGIFLIFANGAMNLWKIPHLSKGITVSIFVWMLLLLLITGMRVQTWSNEEVFLTVTAQDHPNSARAHGELANFYIKNNDFDNAIIELQLAEELRPHDAGIVIHQLIVSCRRPDITETISNRVLKKVNDSVITPYLISSMDSLLRNSLAGLCPTIKPDLLLSITSAMLRNKSIMTYPQWYPMVLTLQARAYLINDQFTNAMSAYQRSFDADNDNTSALIEKATVAIAYQRWDIAESVLVQFDKFIETRMVKHEKERAELWEAIHAYKQKEF